MDGVLTLYGNNRMNVKICWDDIGSDILLAGVPLGADGKIHNGAGAIGINTRNLTRRFQSDADIVIDGYVNKAEAEDLSGISLSDEAITAMRRICFTDDASLLALLNND